MQMTSCLSFYNMVVDAQCGKYNNLRLIWQRHLNCDIEENVWENIIANTGWSIRDIWGKFTHYKIIHRYYYTSVRLHKMGLIQNNLCWKSIAQAATFLHSLWECSFIFPFLEGGYRKTEAWESSTRIPQLCLLGDRSRSPPEIAKAEFGLALTGLNSASRIILRHWKSQTRPEYTDWVDVWRIMPPMNWW